MRNSNYWITVVGEAGVLVFHLGIVVSFGTAVPPWAFAILGVYGLMFFATVRGRNPKLLRRLVTLCVVLVIGAVGVAAAGAWGLASRRPLLATALVLGGAYAFMSCVFLAGLRERLRS